MSKLLLMPDSNSSRLHSSNRTCCALQAAHNVLVKTSCAAIKRNTFSSKHKSTNDEAAILLERCEVNIVVESFLCYRCKTNIGHKTFAKIISLICGKTIKRNP